MICSGKQSRESPNTTATGSDAPPPESCDAVPSEEELRQRAKEVRKSWSESTRKRRRVMADPPPLTVPIIRTAEISCPDEGS